jgi:hypothetical protein
VVAPRQVIGEVAPLAVPPLLRPPARANRHMLSFTLMRYCLLRMSLCRSACDGFSTMQGRVGAATVAADNTATKRLR